MRLALASEQTMHVKDVARTVVFVASLPLDASVQFVIVIATHMPTSLVGSGR